MNRTKTSSVFFFLRGWTLSKKLQFAFGLLLILMAIVALTSIWWISQVEGKLSQALKVEGPLGASMQGMELNVNLTVEEVTKYLTDREPADLLQLHSSVEGFKKNSEDFERLAGTAELKKSGSNEARLFAKLNASGDALLELGDRRYDAFTLFRQNEVEIKKSLNEALNGVSPQQPAKRDALFSMVMSTGDISDIVEAYTNAPTPAMKQQLQQSETEFSGLYKKLQAGDSSKNEKRKLAFVDKDFLNFEKSANQVVTLTDDLRTGLDDFEAAGREAAAFIDHVLQPQVSGEAVRTTKTAQESVEMAAASLFVLVSAGMVIGLVSAWGITNAIVHPLSRLVRGADEIGRGNLRHRIRPGTEDEIGELAAAFNRMAENLEISQQNLSRRTEELQQEIVERRRTEEALRESREQYRRLNENLEEAVKQKVAELQQAQSLAALGQVVAVVAHEIRNPLQNVFFAVEELKEAIGEDGEKTEILERVNFGVNVINGIVSELLQYSRPVSLNPASSKVRDIVRQALDMAGNKLENIAVTINLEQEEQEIVVDAEKVVRVLANIIRNALESMPNGGVLSIYSKLREREKTFLLGVSDTGEGIAPETLRRVREPFFTTKASGTGLGIPICEKILAAHNGKLQIKSDVGKGTTVEIVFPIS